MIGVGINENVILTGAQVSDKGYLILSFDEAKNVGQVKLDIFDALQSATVDNGGKTGFNLNIFPFKTPDGPKNETKTADEKLQMVSDDTSKVKSQLTQLLEVFLTSDKIVWTPYDGTGIDRDNYRTSLLDNAKLALVFENYCKQFINMVTPFLNNPAYKMRLKLVRQSKDKHFATLPGKFLQDNPFVEIMDVPAAQSRVAFTKWEKENKYDDGTPIARAENSNGQGAIPEPAATANVFGNR